MSLKTQITQELTQFASSGGGPFALDLPTAAGRLTANVLAADRLACAFDALTLTSDKLANKSIDDLKQISNRLCAKLSYLLEPIALIETDVDTCTTQLRSNPPLQEDDQTFYYEILVRKGGTISLCRYQKQPGNVRQTVAANLTHEVLARLGEDFDAAAGS